MESDFFYFFKFTFVRLSANDTIVEVKKERGVDRMFINNVQPMTKAGF